MDRRERSGELLAGLLALQQSWAGELYVAMPAIVQSFDPAKRTCVLQPAVSAQVMDETGTRKWVEMPLLLDCPVVFPGGGDVVLTFPLKKGDEVLVIFSDRCIDAWWQSGCPLDANGQLQTQPQAELRMHDLSDGYCIPGPSSVPRVEAAIDATKATLRSRDGQALVSLDPSGHEIHVTAPGADVQVAPNVVHATTPGAVANMTTDSIALTVGTATFNLAPTVINMGCGGSAAISVSANTISMSGTVNINGRTFLTHTHTDPQGGNTGGVV